MGFTIVAKGFSSVNVDVVVKIVISWLISPVVSGALAFIFFALIRKFVMLAQDPVSSNTMIITSCCAAALFLHKLCMRCVVAVVLSLYSRSLCALRELP